MKRFLVKSLIFTIPFLILFGTIAIVDPYEYFGLFEFLSTNEKQKISYRLNYALWKLIKFRRNPVPNILLGDSRMNKINPDKIKEFSGEVYYNFSYGGGTLNEICKTFWEASKKTELKNVYIGINFNQYNVNNSRDRVSGAIATIENPLLYLVNRDVLNATFRMLMNFLTDEGPDIETPPISKDQFWDYQLNITTKRYYANYKYPSRLHAELQNISKYCRQRHINLFFVILPTHISLQEKIKEYGLADAKDKFLSDLRELGKVYDFDYRNELTEDRGNFSDPYHIRKDLLILIIHKIWVLSEMLALL